MNLNPNRSVLSVRKWLPTGQSCKSHDTSILQKKILAIGILWSHFAKWSEWRKSFKFVWSTIESFITNLKFYTHVMLILQVDNNLSHTFHLLKKIEVTFAVFQSYGILLSDMNLLSNIVSTPFNSLASSLSTSAAIVPMPSSPCALLLVNELCFLYTISSVINTLFKLDETLFCLRIESIFEHHQSLKSFQSNYWNKTLI